jgi:dienelactone hydrolase
MRRSITFAASFLTLLVVSAASPAAQTKPTLTPADYDQFESVSPGAARGGLSPNGKWLVYNINRIGGDNELRIIPAAGTSEAPKVVAFGSGASFTSNSEWLAYGIGQSEAEQERLRNARLPVQRKLGLLNLATKTETIIDGVESFAFDRTGQSIAMKRYAPAPAGAPAAATAPAGPPQGGRGGPGGAGPAAAIGSTLMVRDLATGTTMTFGNVSEYAWQASDNGRLLAMIISAEGQAGNGIHLFNPATSVLKVLDASSADYSSLVWRNDSADLVALRSKTNDKFDGPTQVALAWTSLGQPGEKALTLDATTGALPITKRLVTFRRPSWLETGADDARMILLGVADWTPKPPAPEGGRGGRGAAAPPEKADVDIWHWNDTTVMSAQKLSVAADRRRNLPAVWHLSNGQLVVVGKTFDEQLTPIRGTRTAIVSEFTPYLMDRSIGRPAADVELVDLITGTRTPLKTRATSGLSVSPTGKYAIYSEGGNYWTINLATKAVTNITKGVKTSFVDVESDSTAPEKPMFGIAGWTKDDGAVVLNDQFDLWKVSPDGSNAVKLTSGAATQVRHRYFRVDAAGFGAAPEPVDLDEGYLSIFGTRSKKSGYARFASGAGGAVTPLVWLDKSVSGLAKAEKADVFIYTVQGSDDSPDLFVGGPGRAKATQVTATNPFLSKYAWGHTELVDYVVESKIKGAPKMTLQGSLYYPANYEPGKKYPMVVYLYEKLSDGLHQFTPPSERSYYNGTALTQQGYFYFQPDIVFQPREPGVSVVECVTAAVKKVVDMGVVDGAKVGVMGHSWGGFDAMYLATHSNIFAAAVSGAGISDLVSNYGNGHWSSGIAETDHIETGQQRMVVPLYDDLQAYIRNSAVFGISTMTTPLLLEAGDQDGTVYWHQSVELYNIARRAKKNVVMLVYNGEDHGLRVKKNQIDYHRRIGQWFGHYLKGEPAPDWIKSGVPAISR